MSCIALEVGSHEWEKFMLNEVGVEPFAIPYLRKGFHLKFEKANCRNNTNFFKKMYKKHKKFMNYHVNMTSDIFEWNNFNAWKSNT
jgi:hypothetical protein